MAKIKLKKNDYHLENKNFLQKYANLEFLTNLLCDTKYLGPISWILLTFEVFLNLFIIWKVNYTEIDWIAYMQEVEGFLNGTLDYRLLKGDTGPLVYPAGFVYVYSILYYLTSHGKNIRLAQYIFLLLYIAQQYLTFRIYRKTAKVPPYALIIACLTSYRIHSIYVLRLFNDPVAVLLFYAALNAWISNRWLLGSFLYSLAVSIKMNILLYAPCLLLTYLTNLTLDGVFVNMWLCGLVQLALGLPFLLVNPLAYLKGSFDLSRVFEHKWTVNYRFLSIELFENRYFHISLLILHVILLLVFLPYFKRYLSSYAKLNQVAMDVKKQLSSQQKKQNNKRQGTVSKKENELDFTAKGAQLLVLPFFITNLIGVTCARSLHYQFYSWYFHSLLYLCYCTNFKKPLTYLLLAFIELCWNTYPSTNLSSVTLHVCHLILLGANFNYMRK